jgi:hypothetical protein
VLFAATMPNDQAVIDAWRRRDASTRPCATSPAASTCQRAEATRKGADDVVVAERVVADAFKQLVGSLHPAAATAAASARCRTGIACPVLQ